MNQQDVQLEAIIAELKQKPGALLPVLHRVQTQLGYISPTAQALIAKGLNLSTAEIHGVVSFYEDFKTEPGAKHTLQICRAEACQSVGGRQLEQHLKNQLGIEYHQATKDNQLQLEPVYCLGNCACAPSIKFDQKIHGRVTIDLADRLIKSVTNCAEADS